MAKEPKKKYHTETEEKIGLVLWTHVFAGDLDDVTVQQICQEAGVSRDTFYRHFSSPRQAISQTTVRYQTDYIRRNAAAGGGFSGFLTRLLDNMARNGKYISCLPLLYELDMGEGLAATMADELQRQGFLSPITDNPRYQDYEKRLITTGFSAITLAAFRQWAQDQTIQADDVYSFIMDLYRHMILYRTTE